jgi:hypothetical protein
MFNKHDKDDIVSEEFTLDLKDGFSQKKIQVPV